METLDLIQLYSNAVCDIFLISLFFIPILITLVQDRYTLGGGWCTFSAYFLPTSIMVYLVLMNAFGTVLRVWLLDKPPKVRSTVPLSRVYGVMVGCGVLSLVPTLTFPALGADEECFMVGKLSCSLKPKHGSSGLKIAWWIYTMVLIALPLTILVSANVYAGRVISRVLKNSRTATREQKCRVSMTLSTISWSFLLSYLPIIIIHVIKLAGWKGDGGGGEPSWCLVPTFCLPIASLCNPFILYISNTKFRDYIRGMFSQERRCSERRDGEGNDSTKTSSCKITAKNEVKNESDV